MMLQKSCRSKSRLGIVQRTPLPSGCLAVKLVRQFTKSSPSQVLMRIVTPSGIFIGVGSSVFIVVVLFLARVAS